jgi:hypothetical protein
MPAGGARFSLELVWVPLPAFTANVYFMMAARAQQLVNPLREAIELVSTEIDMNFMQEGRPASWAPLAESTISHRLSGALGGPAATGVGTVREDIDLGTLEYGAQIMAALMGDVKILQRTGTLRDAATDPSSWVIEASGNQAVAVLQDVVGYGHFHVEGTEYMPMRDWTYVSDEALDEAMEYWADWVTEPWSS